MIVFKCSDVAVSPSVASNLLLSGLVATLSRALRIDRPDQFPRNGGRDRPAVGGGPQVAPDHDAQLGLWVITP